MITVAFCLLGFALFVSLVIIFKLEKMVTNRDELIEYLKCVHQEHIESYMDACKDMATQSSLEREILQTLMEEKKKSLEFSLHFEYNEADKEELESLKQVKEFLKL